ncbi:HEAT repeat domain-containing protein [Zavarzinella formosa]|uniref:HEAT repeat domain-containing protein n=1 Tax=Zavarzinella formosa TaxID=360055 RepID=UPI0012FCD28D|nr:HEAT repeat domain-containing protein [Zavarzinella formosa]
MTWFSRSGTIQHRLSPLARLSLVSVLLFPAVLLVSSVLWVRHTQSALPAALIGLGVLMALTSFVIITRWGTSQVMSGKFLLFFYLVAYTALRFIEPDLTSPWFHLVLSLCLLTPVCVFMYRELTATGGNIRRAKFLLGGIIRREEWPDRYEDIRQIPEIRHLREVLRENPSPALTFLSHPNPKIQAAVLTALEFQPSWRKDQADAVIHRANFTDEPLVRAAAVMALACVSKSRHLACLVPFLSDDSAEVRRAAGIALLWDARTRWNDLRSHIRTALAQPHAGKDGALPCSGTLPVTAIHDLLMWAGETGTVGKRATQTLLRHCKKTIEEDGSPEAIERMVSMLQDPKVMPSIRVEIAHRLQNTSHLAPEVAVKLLSSNQPTMLRVIAAGAMLSQREDSRAVDVLRDAARQPNREIALAAAVIIQKFLGVDMGLPMGNELPNPNSRIAAEVTRRVIKWSAGEFGQSAVDTPAEGIPVPGWDD